MSTLLIGHSDDLEVFIRETLKGEGNYYIVRETGRGFFRYDSAIKNARSFLSRKRKRPCPKHIRLR